MNVAPAHWRMIGKSAKHMSNNRSQTQAGIRAKGEVAVILKMRRWNEPESNFMHYCSFCHLLSRY